jgi:hypothetical protein
LIVPVGPIEASGLQGYDRPMRRFRPVLIIALSLVVSAQPLASAPCVCAGHAKDAAMPAHGADHRLQGSHSMHSASGDHRVEEMPVPDSSSHDSADSNDCNAMGMVCKCGACAHFVGLIDQVTHVLTMTAPEDHASAPRYVEPPREPAFRPPIHV